MIVATGSFFLFFMKTILTGELSKPSKTFSLEYRALTVGEFANGAEVAITLIVWPTFHEILNGDVFEIGAVSTIIVAITIVLKKLVGKHLDDKDDVRSKLSSGGAGSMQSGGSLRSFVLSCVSSIIKLVIPSITWYVFSPKTPYKNFAFLYAVTSLNKESMSTNLLFCVNVEPPWSRLSHFLQLN